MLVIQLDGNGWGFKASLNLDESYKRMDAFCNTSQSLFI